MKKIVFHMALLMLVCGVLSGCENTQEQERIKEAKFHLYYLSTDETELIPDVYSPTDETPQVMFQELMEFLQSGSYAENTLPLLPENVKISTHSINEGTLTIDFNEAYDEMSDTREVLTRAGVVKLFAQLPDVEYVKFTVNGQEIKDSHGNPLSIMNGDTFVEYNGEDINSYEYVTMNLYFTNKEGSLLIPEEREVYYNSNIPLERVVVEQLLKGPQEEGLYPTLPSGITIIGVTTDGTDCYVNLDTTFVDSAISTQEVSVPIYSIVNSLVDDCQMENVQISINGETNINYKDSVPLNQFFKRNAELVSEAEEPRD